VPPTHHSALHLAYVFVPPCVPVVNHLGLNQNYSIKPLTALALLASNPAPPSLPPSHSLSHPAGPKGGASGGIESLLSATFLTLLACVCPHVCL
jgi:hypothetical protein